MLDEDRLASLQASRGWRERYVLHARRAVAFVAYWVFQVRVWHDGRVAAVARSRTG